MLQMGAMLHIFPMEALDFILNYTVRFHLRHGRFKFFHLPTLVFGCVTMAGQFEHSSQFYFDLILQANEK